MSDGSVHDVRVFLRYLLRETGIEDQDWFCYAEAQVYAEPLEWWPLLGKKLRGGSNRRRRKKKNGGSEPWFDIAQRRNIAKGDDNPGTWYKKWADATKEEKVLSLVRALEDQFEATNPVLEPILGLFIADSATIEKEFPKITGLSEEAASSVPFFRYLPDRRDQENKAQDQYKNYLEKIRDTIKFDDSENNDSKNNDPGNDDSEKRIYPEGALVLALPLFVVESGSPRLLATMIMICEAPLGRSPRWSNRSVIQRLWEIARSSAQFQQRGSVELSRRFHGVIDGFYAGGDPVTLLAHPAWTSRANRQIMQLQDQGHDGLDKFGIGGYERNDSVEDEDLRKGHLFSRVFQRSLTPYRRSKCTPSKSTTSTALGCWDGRRGDAFEKWLKEGAAKGEYSNFTKPIHRWLKALYCYRREAERHAVPVSKSDKNYALTFHLEWLIELVTSVPSSHSTLEVKCWPDIPESDEASAFYFPVTPGARFLIPWLAMLQHLVNWGNKRDQLSAEVLIISFTGEATSSSGVSEAFSWIKRWTRLSELQNSKSAWCAMVTKIESKDQKLLSTESKYRELLNAAAGWRRTLYGSGSRRGADTGHIADVLGCNVGPAFDEKGLPVDRSCDLFRPIDTTGIISLDIESWEEEGKVGVIVAFSW